MSAPAPSKGAPGRLETVRSFLNTVDLEGGLDTLTDHGALRAWLVDHQLMSSSERLTGPADLQKATVVREALRAVLVAEHDEKPPSDLDLSTLAGASLRAGFILSVNREGRIQFEPSAHGIDGAIGRLLAIAAEAGADGTWDRFKVCSSDTCRWAFYDVSRNHSRRWCDMAVCGNRAKARRFRTRD